MIVYRFGYELLKLYAPCWENTWRLSTPAADICWKYWAHWVWGKLKRLWYW